MEVKISEKEDIKILKCSKNIHVETINWDTKESTSEEGNIGLRKFMRRSRVCNMNEEVKGWKSS